MAVTELKVSRRYAQALFELARDRNVLEQVGAELADLAGTLRSAPQAKQFLSNAVVEEQAKRQFLEQVMSRTGAGELLRRFVELLVTRGRSAYLPTIEDQFREMSELHRGVLSVEVETAQSLKPEARERLTQSLTRYTGRTVRLTERLRPELVAGFRVQLGSLLIDGTLDRQLQQLNRAIVG